MGDVFEDHLDSSRKQPRSRLRRQGRRPRRPLLRRLRRLPEGDRLRRRPRDPGHAAGLPADAPRGGGRGRQARLHREAGRRRRPGHPQGAGRGRGGEEEEPGRRRRHPAPAPGRLPRDHEADPRRRDRRDRRGPLLLEPGQPLDASRASRPGATWSGSSATGSTSPGSPATTSSSSTSTTSTSSTGRCGAHPVRAVGMGGRQVRTGPEYGHIYDHFAIDYEYPERRPRAEHVPPDRRLREQRLRGGRRHQGDAGHSNGYRVRRATSGPRSGAEARSTPTTRSTST